MDLICRTCLAYDDELEPLFTKKLVDTDYKELTTMILLCTGLQISKDDNLANTICSQCIESTIAAFKYRKKVWNSNTVLLETSNVLEDVTGNNKYFVKMNTCNEPILETFKVNIPDPDFQGLSQLDEEKNSSELNSNNSTMIAELKAVTTDYQKSCIINDEFIRVAPSDLSHNEDKQSYIEFGPNDTTNIAKLKNWTRDNQKNYKNMDQYIRISDKSTTMRPYSCTICNQTYEIVGPLRKHMLKNHNITAKKAFRCSTCSKTFVGDHYFRRHLKEAHQPESMKQNHVCDLCGKAFKYRSALVEHLNRHNGKKPFKCDICEYATVAMSALKVHIRSHTGEKPYICHICGAGFKSSSHRSDHINEAHTDGKPYECVICSKTFKSRRVYMSHNQIHNPNQNIKCDICDKKFNYRKNLKVHMRQHGDKTFKCTMCDKAFHQKQNCQTHMKNVHHIDKM